MNMSRPEGAHMKNNARSAVNAPNRDDPLWYKEAVIYQLHVKSFFDSNNDGVGDFPGLLQKLDYIAELGVDTIWLLPFYPSPRRDDGYDIADYRGVHPDYGTLADARRFVRAAHARGLRVITELVVNHTSDQHPWFQRARRSRPGSKYRNYYVWSDNDQKYRDTRIIFLDTEKSNWTWDAEAQAYFWHRFYSHQPDLNYDNPQVLKEILAVMHYWMETGIDGLRLDAVPYLVEREGTINENLPETHAVLKAIRADLDRSFANRVLLAEANQWPEDAQEYFGNGDECHMAFHFPLMPRMYMAIAREDRFPITDILRQTPDIPETCQWAVFLRNHDELTLEMVTSSERDYLWETYAKEQRARLNLGIRRRLAPLLERDRRRIELMNSLLLSMPGTPVIYYGDEIGMGDNIHLGDRDGVRTPMQWSPDRNGGFSRADRERLVLPPILGGLYGYESVNVESQQRDPHSLLNWMRRMLAVRRQQRVLGRGTLQFLYPGNRKILAYLRSHEGTDILCVANLSHATQAVELELSAFSSRVPVEMLGGTPFPTIGELPYLLTLPPYGFYWFDLRTDAAPPAWHATPHEQMQELNTLVLKGRTGYQLTENSLRSLQRDVLPTWLRLRRWFAGKNLRIQKAEVRYAVRLPGDGENYLAEVSVETNSGTQCYAVPVALIWDENLQGAPQQLALARVRRAANPGMLTDAFVMPGFIRAVIDHLRNGSEIPVSFGATRGKVRFVPQPGLDNLELGPESELEWLGGEQSNSSVIVGYRAVLKQIRRVAEGVNPEAEMTGYLTTHGYQNTPALLGEVLFEHDGGDSHTLMLLHAYISNQGNAWDWTLEYLRRTLDEIALTGEPADRYDDLLASYNAIAAIMGRRLAELHAVLARDTEDPAFKPRVPDGRSARARASAVSAMFNQALQALERHAWETEAKRGRAAALRALEPAIVERIQKLATMRGGLLIRTHGDLHLGQILIAQSDAYIIDFEGEPVRSMQERRARSTAMRDVAGMLRSFDYAAAAVVAEQEALAHPDTGAGVDPQGTVRQNREALLQRFRESATASFLDSYRSTAADLGGTWLADDGGAADLELALLEKAAYEACYEAANRPRWIDIPLRGLADIATRLANPPADRQAGGPA